MLTATELQKEVGVFYRRIEEFQNSKSGSLFLLLQQNLYYRSVVIKNFYELNKAMTLHYRGENDKHFWNIKNRSGLQKEIARLIFNYLSSLFGFIDFTRANNVKYLKNNHKIFAASERCNILVKDPTHRFIQDLRNFTIHYNSLSIGFEIKTDISWSEPRRNIYVEKHLLEGFEWKKESIEFLKTQPDKVYIFPILKQHFIEFKNVQSDLFKLLLQVKPVEMEQFLNHIEGIYNQSVVIQTSESIPFSLPYLKYIRYQIKKSHKNFETDTRKIDL